MLSQQQWLMNSLTSMNFLFRRERKNKENRNLPLGKFQQFVHYFSLIFTMKTERKVLVLCCLVLIYNASFWCTGHRDCILNLFSKVLSCIPGQPVVWFILHFHSFLLRCFATSENNSLYWTHHVSRHYFWQKYLHILVVRIFGAHLGSSILSRKPAPWGEKGGSHVEELALIT